MKLGKMEQQTLALAGVAQSARLVDQLSRTGTCPEEFLLSSVKSLFVFDSDNIESIYGGVPGAKLGLQNLASMLANRQGEENSELLRYTFSILYLERKFSSNPQMMSVIRSRLEHTQFRNEHFSNHIQDTCHSISGIYQDTLSNLKFRIKVTGAAEHLQDTQTADTIRALLLAGVRSAFLWRQLGGRRYKLVWQRKRLLAASQNLSRNLGVV